MTIITKIITNILTALYEPFAFAVLLAILFTFLYLFAQQNGWKVILRQWWAAFRSDSFFRRLLLLAFYTAMILFRTLLNRNMWANPLSDVIGVWGIYNEEGELTTEAIENLMLFIPFVVLVFCCFRDRILKDRKGLGAILWGATKYTFLFSLSIEFLQLFLRLGTFQLCDLFYNTLGGTIGGLIYWGGYTASHRKDGR